MQSILLIIHRWSRSESDDFAGLRVSETSLLKWWLRGSHLPALPLASMIGSANPLPQACSFPSALMPRSLQPVYLVEMSSPTPPDSLLSCVSELLGIIVTQPEHRHTLPLPPTFNYQSIRVCSFMFLFPPSLSQLLSSGKDSQGWMGGGDLCFQVKKCLPWQLQPKYTLLLSVLGSMYVINHTLWSYGTATAGNQGTCCLLGDWGWSMASLCASISSKLMKCNDF